MPKIGLTGSPDNTKTQGLYDRIADVQNLAMKINGYRSSVAKYLCDLEIDLGPESVVLDAGSGTGIVTLAFQDAGFEPGRMIALDLSYNSLKVSRSELTKRRKYAKRTDAVQGNVLNLPFADDTFELVMMCGVLEYTPLDEGLSETARVLKTGAKLILLPVKESVVGSVLEVLYNFKIHPVEKVHASASKHFRMIDKYEFPKIEPIAWSKSILLLEKK